jgi:DNA-binding transcriptional LysR family regulator
MRKVADAFSLTTSTVPQQIAALAKEAGERLIEPDGRRVRLTRIRVSLLPIVRDLAATDPGVEEAISEYEPLEAFDLLVDDDLDLAITYDDNLAPASPTPYSKRGRCGRLYGVWAFGPILRRTI